LQKYFRSIIGECNCSKGMWESVNSDWVIGMLASVVAFNMTLWSMQMHYKVSMGACDWMQGSVVHFTGESGQLSLWVVNSSIFWPAENKRPTRLCPGYFLNRPDDIYPDPVMADPTWPNPHNKKNNPTLPGSKNFALDPSLHFFEVKVWKYSPLFHPSLELYELVNPFLWLHVDFWMNWFNF